MDVVKAFGADPSNDPSDLVWASTRAELGKRGIEHPEILVSDTRDRSVESGRKGRTGIVVKGKETSSGRTVALKIYLAPDETGLQRDGKLTDMATYVRNEQQMLSLLKDCPVVPQYFYTVDKDNQSTVEHGSVQPFHVLEYIDGQTMHEIVASRKVNSNKVPSKKDIDDALGLLNKVLTAVESIHQHGVIHRDVSANNVMFDKHGKAWLVDVAGSSPSQEQETRLETVNPGWTPGSQPDPMGTRKTKADDISAACTIGYALFTGHWRDPKKKETVADWRAKLDKYKVPRPIQNILLKGMKPRDATKAVDETVWNSASDVRRAVRNYQSSERRKKQTLLTVLSVAAFAALLSVAAMFWADRTSNQVYYQNVARAKDGQAKLAVHPQRLDERVRIRSAECESSLEKAATAKAEGRVEEAGELANRATDKVEDALELADKLQQLKPLLAPLQALLQDNRQWDTDCPFIANKLASAQEKYLDLKRELDSENLELAWDKIADLQNQLASLMRDNHESWKVTELFEQFDIQRLGLAVELAESEELQKFVKGRMAAEEIYCEGQWNRAKDKLLTQQAGLEDFLEKNETEEQRDRRLQSGTRIVEENLATIDRLRRNLTDVNDNLKQKDNQITSLSKQVAKSETDLTHERKRTSKLEKQLNDVGEQLGSTQDSLDTQSRELEDVTNDRDRLARQSKKDLQRLMGQTVTRLNTKIEKIQFENQNLSKTLSEEKAKIKPLLSLAKVDSALTAAQLETELRKRQAELQLAKKHREVAAILDTPENQILLKPFTDRSRARVSKRVNYAVFVGTPRVYEARKELFEADDLPMSYSTIQGSGALEESELGRNQLIKLAQVQGDFRTDWANPTTAEDFLRVRKAQKLLKELGDIMVQMGYLSD